MKSLLDGFYQAFDQSFSDDCFRKTLSGSNQSLYGLKNIGEGTYFQTLTLPSPVVASEHKQKMKLVLKIAKENFVSSGRMNQGWQQAIRKVQMIRHPLIPPFEILRHADRLAMVMPLADHVCALSREDRVMHMSSLNSELVKYHLRLDDLLQIGELKSSEGLKHSFVFDWSDLNTIA